MCSNINTKKLLTKLMMYFLHKNTLNTAHRMRTGLIMWQICVVYCSKRWSSPPFRLKRRN